MNFLLIIAIFSYAIMLIAIWANIKLKKMVSDWRDTNEGKEALGEARRLYPDEQNLVVYPSGHADGKQRITLTISVSFLIGSLFMAFYLFG